MPKFVKVPEVYPKLLELRKSKTASFKQNPYLKETTKLRYYQVVGSLHMLLLSRMILGDATGLGKTLENIAAYTFLLERDPTLKWLVVCSKSAVYQWAEEIDKFCQGISYRVINNKYEGLERRAARMKQYEDFKENVLIMHYHPILEEYEFIKRCLGDNYMVSWDECTNFKNRKTKTHFAAQQISESASRVYGLSATIIKNGLEEVYGIFNVVVPGLFGLITHFKRDFCIQKKMKLRIKGKIRQIPKVTGYKNLKEFKTIIDPYLLVRKKEEVASELPKLISRKIILEMDSDQSELYREALTGVVHEEKVRQEFFEISDKVRNGADDERTLKKYEELSKKYEELTTTEGKKKSKLAALTYCQMISNGPGLINAPGSSSKEAEFERLMTEELVTEKVIVFTRFKSGIPYLEKICDQNKIGYAKIHGDITDAKDRDKERVRFTNDPNCRVIFITTAGSESLNLQAAGVLIFYDTPWSWGDLVQTIGRAQRLGSIQEHILLLHFVNKNTIDMRVINRVTDKKHLSDEVLGDTAKGALDFTAAEDSVIDDLFHDLLEDARELVA